MVFHRENEGYLEDEVNVAVGCQLHLLQPDDILVFEGPEVFEFHPEGLFVELHLVCGQIDRLDNSLHHNSLTVGVVEGFEDLGELALALELFLYAVLELRIVPVTRLEFRAVLVG